MSEPKTATARPTETIAVSEVAQFLEGIAESLAAIESRLDKNESAVEDIKADTEEILNNLDNISFKADYPGLED